MPLIWLSKNGVEISFLTSMWMTLVPSILNSNVWNQYLPNWDCNQQHTYLKWLENTFSYTSYENEFSFVFIDCSVVYLHRSVSSINFKWDTVEVRNKLTWLVRIVYLLNQLLMICRYDWSYFYQHIFNIWCFYILNIQVFIN